MTGWILRVILLIVVIRLIWRFLSGVLDGMLPQSSSRSASGSGSKGGAQGGNKGGAASVPLVQDPVCGTYVVRARALTAGSGEATQYFCSEKCRDEFARRRA